jgi:RimJ/RimL family protein N-acetyltransferase
MGDPVMTEHLGGPESEEKLRSRHERYCRIAATGPNQVFVIMVEPDAIPAGSVLYWESESHGEPMWEVGWSVLPEYQGRGVATRGTQLALDHAAAQRRHRYAHAFPMVDNLASNRLCERLGFELIETMDFEYPPGNPVTGHNWRRALW